MKPNHLAKLNVQKETKLYIVLLAATGTISEVEDFYN